VAVERGVGKCEENHTGSFGYPTRPEEPYDFCSQCGKAMAWECPTCRSPLPYDTNELIAARFCRDCGSPYFPDSEEAEKAESA